MINFTIKWLLLSTVWLSFDFISCVKRKATDTVDRQRNNSPVVTDDPAIIVATDPQQRSLEQWKTFTREALVLYTNANNIQATGTHEQLASALFEHFQSSLSSTASSAPATNESSSSKTATTASSTSQPTSVSQMTAPVVSHVAAPNSSSLANMIREQVEAAVANLFTSGSISPSLTSSNLI
uniref:Cnidarian restricted protein n=1 Tax=Clytia hemisphaerica TaxID=252671 RepID=A0A7M5TUC8_9CNID